jgi:hypothetical protein
MAALRHAHEIADRPLLADTRPRIHLMAVNTSAVFRPYRNSVQALPASALCRILCKAGIVKRGSRYVLIFRVSEFHKSDPATVRGPFTNIIESRMTWHRLVRDALRWSGSQHEALASDLPALFLRSSQTSSHVVPQTNILDRPA